MYSMSIAFDVAGAVTGPSGLPVSSHGIMPGPDMSVSWKYAVFQDSHKHCGMATNRKEHFSRHTAVKNPYFTVCVSPHRGEHYQGHNLA